MCYRTNYFYHNYIRLVVGTTSILLAHLMQGQYMHYSCSTGKLKLSRKLCALPNLCEETLMVCACSKTVI
jgi:hypothetical protein